MWFHILRLALPMSSLLIVGSLFLAPALAASENGKGHGRGGINGGSSAGGNSSNASSNGSTSQSSNRSNGSAIGKSKPDIGIAANQLGRLNGFFRASPMALRKASADSAIGKISVVYAGLLQSYLESFGSAEPTGPTVTELANALLDATNKPLTPEIVSAINQRLSDTNADLGTLITNATNTANPSPLNLQDLATAIANEADLLSGTAVTSIY